MANEYKEGSKTREELLVTIKNFKVQVKALESKITSSHINQKYLDADRKRSHWHTEYVKMKEEYERLKVQYDEKQKHINLIKKNVLNPILKN